MLNIPRNLILEFLGTFARFEFALKKSGYILSNERGVLPDWNRYSDDLAALDQAALTQVFQAAEYLENHPPKKQISRDGQLDWAFRIPEKSRIRGILLDIRTVRNNLFHGGKFPKGPVDDPARDERLIQSCLAVLYSLLELPAAESVAQYFKEGI